MDGTRRTFLKAAVTAAGAAATTDLAQADRAASIQGDAHQAIPSDLTLRVKSLESLLVEKGLVDRAALDALDRHDGAQDRPAQRSSSRRAGVGRSGLQETLARACAGGDRRAWLHQRPGRAHARRREHSQGPQPGGLHAVLLLSMAGAGPAARLVQVGAVPIAERSSIRAASSKSLERTSRKTSRCASGTAPRSCATSCSRSVRPEPNG